MTPAGIEPANFLFVAQHLNHCATAVYSYVARVINSFTGNILTALKIVIFKIFYLYQAL